MKNERIVKSHSIYMDSNNELIYSLIRSTISDDNEYGNSYSISISKINRKTAEIETEIARDITRIHSFAERMYDAVVSGLVTPITLNYIILDFIST